MISGFDGISGSSGSSGPSIGSPSSFLFSNSNSIYLFFLHYYIGINVVSPLGYQNFLLFFLIIHV